MSTVNLISKKVFSYIYWKAVNTAQNILLYFLDLLWDMLTRTAISTQTTGIHTRTFPFGQLSLFLAMYSFIGRYSYA